MTKREELNTKIAENEATIAQMEKQIAESDHADVFGRMNIVEYKREIKDCQERNRHLTQRLDGTADPGPTDDQLERMDWVLSDAYDDE